MIYSSNHVWDLMRVLRDTNITPETAVLWEYCIKMLIALRVEPQVLTDEQRYANYLETRR